MDDVPKPRTWHRGRWLILTVLLVLALICAPIAWRVYAVAAVQSTVCQPHFISFEGVDAARARRIPRDVENHVEDFLKWVCKGKPRGADRIWIERFRAAYCDPVTEVFVSGKLRGDLGSALLRFPELRVITVIGSPGYGPTEQEFALLCEQLRTKDSLEILRIGGDTLRNDSLKPLRGHPKLQSLSISNSPGISPEEVLEILVTLPALHSSHISGVDMEQFSDVWNRPENRDRIRAVHPKLKIMLSP